MKKVLLIWISVFISLLGFKSAWAEDRVLYFYNWSEYIPTDILAEFTDQTGIKVIYATYESNEALYAKLKTHPEGYDLIVPSTYYISKMRQEDMIQKLDKQKITHFSDLDPKFLGKEFDPNNDYSIPYVWGATGIGVNTDFYNKDIVSSWADLWSINWENQLMMLDDSREFFHLALKKLGYSANTTNPDEIQAAYEELKLLMPNVLVFNSDFPANPYIAGETSLGMIWNGAAYAARQEGISLEVIWPTDGAIFWMDSLAIPKNAKNIDEAYEMINFLLRPENAARITEEIGYPTPVLSAYALMPKEFINDPNVFPPQDVIENGQWQNDVGEASRLYEELFQKLKVEQ